MTISSIEKEFDEQLPKLYKYNFFNGVESYTTCGEEVKSFYRQKINEREREIITELFHYSQDAEELKALIKDRYYKL